MNPLETIKTRFEEKREQALNEEIEQVAGRVAVGLIDSLGTGEVGPYNFAVGKSPKGIASEEYLEKINSRVSQMLGRFSRTEEITYDPEASRLKSHQANTLPIAAVPTEKRHTRDGLVIVYR